MPVDLHSGSNSITMAEEFERQFDCLRENTNRFLVPIKKRK